MVRADGAALPPLVEKSRQLREEFESRHAVWAAELPPGELKNLMVEQAYQPGIAFLDLRDKEFIPALLGGNRAAAEAILPRLGALYARHRAAIDQVVVLANARNVEDEKAAAAIIAGNHAFLASLGAGIKVIKAVATTSNFFVL